jgi:Nucleoside 2-deoxyribosyltransferase like
MLYIEAPNRVYNTSKKSIFLAGTITEDPTNWQQLLVEALKDFDIVIYNPRRAKFPMDDPSAALEQITWEYEMLNSASMISFYFAPDTISPITLLELGRFLMTQKPLAIGVAPTYKRKQDVEIQTRLARPEVPIVYSLKNLVEVVSEQLNQIMEV